MYIQIKMKKSAQIFSFFLLSFFLISCISLPENEKPLWADSLTLRQVFPREKYITALGYADTPQMAATVAEGNLASYFSKEISRSVKATQILSNTEEASESMLSDIEIKSQFELFGIQHTETYFNPDSKNYTVCAYINKEEAFNILSQKLSFYERDFYQKAKLVKTETEGFRKIKILNDAISNETEITKMYEYSQLIDSEKTKKYDVFLLQLKESKNILFKLKQSNPFSVFTNGDYSEEINSVISEILAENGFIISANADYKIISNSFCKFTRQIAEQNEIFSCKPSLYVKIEGNSGTIFSCVLSAEEISSYNKQTLTKMVLAVIEDLLYERLSLEL